MDLGLAGRTALISGSHRGTGAGIARTLAAEGARVLVHGFEPGQPDAVVADIIAAGGSASAVVADLATDDAIETLRADVDVDIVVNNYGAPRRSDWSAMEHWADEWNHNVLVGVRVVQALVPSMRDRGWGRVVFVGTMGSRKPGVRSPGYYAAKAGLHALVRSLAIEVRGTGVTANLVSPGMIATAEVRDGLTRRAGRNGIGPDWPTVERWALDNRMPNLTERLPDPDDIGRVVTFLCSQAAWHVNGAELAVDGGALDAG